MQAWCWLKKGVRGKHEPEDAQEDHGHKAELSVAPSVLDMVDLKGNVVTGDALYCQRAICQQIAEGGGDYLVTVKANQKELYEDIALVFNDPPKGEVFAYYEHHGQHGDRVETRRLWSTKALFGYLDWPNASQVCKLEREVFRRGETSVDARYFITSLEAASPKALMEIARGHWGIENRLHWVRDVSMGEDGSQVRSGSAPQVMAALRNVVIGLLRQNAVSNVAAAIRHYGWHVEDALRLIGLRPP